VRFIQNHELIKINAAELKEQLKKLDSYQPARRKNQKPPTRAPKTPWVPVVTQSLPLRQPAQFPYYANPYPQNPAQNPYQNQFYQQYQNNFPPLQNPMQNSAQNPVFVSRSMTHPDRAARNASRGFHT